MGQGMPSRWWPRIRKWPTGKAAPCGFGYVPRIAVYPLEPSSQVGRRHAVGCLAASARRKPLRGLAPSVLLKPCMEQQKHGQQRRYDATTYSPDDQTGNNAMVPGRRRAKPDREHGARAGNRRDRLPDSRFPSAPPPRPGSRQPVGQVDGEASQVRVGPRPERPADPQLELVPAQPFFHECGLEYFDYLLAVGARRQQAALAARARCDLVYRPYHPWAPPHEHDARKRSAAVRQPTIL